MITPSLDEMVTVAKKMDEAGLKIPILIGGATTSKMHTAVKIAPSYSGPSVYVLDASRSVPVCQSLLDPRMTAEFQEDIREQYAEMRDEFYAGLEDRKYASLKDAQTKKLRIDWSDPVNVPVVPKFIGTKVFDNFPLEDVLPYIDWNPFFQVRIIMMLHTVAVQAPPFLLQLLPQPAPCALCLSGDVADSVWHVRSGS